MQRQIDTQKNSYLMMETEAEVMAFKPRFACNYSELPEARKDAPLSDSEGS